MPNVMREAVCVNTVHRGRDVAMLFGGLGNGPTHAANNIVTFDLGRRVWNVIEAKNQVPYVWGALG